MSAASLPPGWFAYRNAEGEEYFYNVNTKETRWDHPCAPQAVAPPPAAATSLPEAPITVTVAAKPEEKSQEESSKATRPARPLSQRGLPVGWYAYRDEAGEEYYYNIKTHETTWERPGGAPPAAAVPAPAPVPVPAPASAPAPTSTPASVSAPAPGMPSAPASTTSSATRPTANKAELFAEIRANKPLQRAFPLPAKPTGQKSVLRSIVRVPAPPIKPSTPPSYPAPPTAPSVAPVTIRPPARNIAAATSTTNRETATPPTMVQTKSVKPVPAAPPVSASEPAASPAVQNPSPVNTATPKGPLPPNWFAYSTPDGETYYYNCETKETSWTWPAPTTVGVLETSSIEELPAQEEESEIQHRVMRASTSAIPTDVPLPPGWFVYRNAVGEEYYYNCNTQETSWERPEFPSSTG